MRIIKEESFGIVPLKHEKNAWKVLVILHKHGKHWGFPKGKPNLGEDPKESASRELHEETGLTVQRFLRDQPYIEEYTFFRKKEKVKKKVHYFPAVVSGAFLLQPEEIRDGKWLSLEKAMQQLTFNDTKAICKKIEELVS